MLGRKRWGVGAVKGADGVGGGGREARWPGTRELGVSRSNFTALASRRRCAPCRAVKPF